MLLFSLSIGVSVGAVHIPQATVWGVILNKISPDLLEQTWTKGREAIVWDIRFPRALLAMMVGASRVQSYLQQAVTSPIQGWGSSTRGLW
mgnify:CR=1 FL=1